MKFEKEQLLDMYERMLIARYFEEELSKQVKSGRLSGPIHLSEGQEATAIGAGEALEPNDYVTLTHRNHAQAIGAGANLNQLMAEIFGKETGTMSGRGGSINFIDPDNHLLNENGIVSGGFPLACGAALTQKLQNTGAAVLCYGGDGSVNEGNFHEALNLAAIWKLPVVFFIENNLYARSTPLEEHSSVINLSERAQSYNMPGITIDGNDVIETFGIVKLALDYARRGEGPVLIEAQTYRISPDSETDSDSYRSEQEIESWKEEDPILRMADYLVHNGYADQEELYNVETSSRRAVAQALNYAKESKNPQSVDLTDQVYA